MATMLDYCCILALDMFLSLEDFLDSFPPELGSIVMPGNGAILSLCL